MHDVEAPISNYYGAPTLRGGPGQWTLVIEDHDGEDSVAVSDAFAVAWIAEFGARQGED